MTRKLSPYTPMEIELFKELYDGDASSDVLNFIIESLNDSFHKGQPIRNKRSILYLIKKLDLKIKPGEENYE